MRGDNENTCSDCKYMQLCWFVLKNFRRMKKYKKNSPATETTSITELWWEEVDSNHRSRGRQIYSLLPLAARESSQIKKMELVNGIEPSTY